MVFTVYICLSFRAFTASLAVKEYFELGTRDWFAFGIPAFTAVAAILWLMIAKPQTAFS